MSVISKKHLDEINGRASFRNLVGFGTGISIVGQSAEERLKAIEEHYFDPYQKDQMTLVHALYEIWGSHPDLFPEAE